MSVELSEFSCNRANSVNILKTIIQMTMTENQQREQNWGIMFSPNLIYCAYDTSHIRKTTINNPSLNILHMFFNSFFQSADLHLQRLRKCC